MLTEFSSPLDPGVKTNMPLFQCGSCDACVQASAEDLGVSHWDELYVTRSALVADKAAEHHAEIPVDYSDAQYIHDRLVEDWLAEHAKQHA